MQKYKKKPVVISAVQWKGDLESARKLVALNPEVFDFTENDGNLTIKTLEGRLKVTANDWIIKGVAGEYRPCKPDIFEATYEKVRSKD